MASFFRSTLNPMGPACCHRRWGGTNRFRTTLSLDGTGGIGGGSNPHAAALRELRQNIGKTVQVKVGSFSGTGKSACFEVSYSGLRGAFYPPEGSPLRRGYNETVYEGASVPAQVKAVLDRSQHFMFLVDIDQPQKDKTETPPAKRAEAPAPPKNKRYVRKEHPSKSTPTAAPEAKRTGKPRARVDLPKELLEGFNSIKNMLETDPSEVHDPARLAGVHLFKYFASPDAAQILFALRSSIKDAEIKIDKVIETPAKYHPHYSAELRKRYDNLVRNNSKK